MTHLHHVLDSVIVAVVSIATAASAVLLGATETADQFAELKLLLLPFLGALILSGGIIMLNPQIETRRIVIGRSIFALFCGTIAPQILAALHPAMAHLSVKPIVQLAVGGLIAMLAYVLSKPLTGQFYRRAEGQAKAIADELERKAGLRKPEKQD